MNFDFYMPVRVVSGRTALADSAAQLKKLGDSCMVVTGKHSAKASGALDDLTEVLRREKISCTVYDGITENPLLSSCEEAAALAAEKKAAFVVGIGGGSPLDAAKAIAALAANPGLDREGFFKKAWKNPAAAHCADRYHLRHRQRGQPYLCADRGRCEKVCFRAGALRVSCHREPGVYRYNVL